MNIIFGADFLLTLSDTIYLLDAIQIYNRIISELKLLIISIRTSIFIMIASDFYFSDCQLGEI